MRFRLSPRLCRVLAHCPSVSPVTAAASRLQYLDWRGKRLLTLRVEVVFFSAPSRGPVHVQTVGLTGSAKPCEFPDDRFETWSVYRSTTSFVF